MLFVVLCFLFGWPLPAALLPLGFPYLSLGPAVMALPTLPSDFDVFRAGSPVCSPLCFCFASNRFLCLVSWLASSQVFVMPRLCLFLVCGFLSLCSCFLRILQFLFCQVADNAVAGRRRNLRTASHVYVRNFRFSHFRTLTVHKTWVLRSLQRALAASPCYSCALLPKM